MDFKGLLVYFRLYLKNIFDDKNRLLTKYLALLLWRNVLLSVRTVGPVTAHINSGQPVDPEGPPPGVRTGPDWGLTVVATVPRDLAHTDRPADCSLLQTGVLTPEPGHSAGAAALPLLGVPLVRQLSPSLALEPVPALLQSQSVCQTTKTTLVASPVASCHSADRRLRDHSWHQSSSSSGWEWCSSHTDLNRQISTRTSPLTSLLAHCYLLGQTSVTTPS